MAKLTANSSREVERWREPRHGMEYVVTVDPKGRARLLLDVRIDGRSSGYTVVLRGTEEQVRQALAQRKAAA